MEVEERSGSYFVASSWRVVLLSFIEILCLMGDHHGINSDTVGKLYVGWIKILLRIRGGEKALYFALSSSLAPFRAII